MHSTGYNQLNVGESDKMANAIKCFFLHGAQKPFGLTLTINHGDCHIVSFFWPKITNVMLAFPLK